MTDNRVAFVVAATDHGALIVNRLDYRVIDPQHTIGVGYEVLERGRYETPEGVAGQQLLCLRRHYFGDGVVAIDCGANIGVLTVEWAKLMTGWGRVIAIEAQEPIYYALAGNIAINNCFNNTKAIHAAVGMHDGTMKMPRPDYQRVSSFGSLELRPSASNEDIGQPIDYSDGVDVDSITIDAMNLARLDLIKIDVEGMELEVLEGAKATIARFLPIIIVEKIKTPAESLLEFLNTHGYLSFALGLNFLAVHPSDASSGHVCEPA